MYYTSNSDCALTESAVLIPVKMWSSSVLQSVSEGDDAFNHSEILNCTDKHDRVKRGNINNMCMHQTTCIPKHA